ncbi:hypothetical protein PA598K_00662 [Paenibacillus sp. 598K]|uniref:hypothetical protein n=1 Tax=Paenibacillus sp. 598K TaxID=1117987 RepID=UPI000FF97558|nr:hypothetical protein [Paenibacillus sp. 598K]GBF72410.1 hypothetical protein PA598K_00662 [Paenibacillus sp. 598K]
MNQVNIINFIRGIEPREPVDLVEPVREQLALVQKHKLPATWLLQYDALIDLRFTDMLLEADPLQEVGIWFEVVQPMAEKAGIAWRGRYPWDWHSHVGFSVGYTPAERERLADVIMAEFYERFGYYPQSVGSWFIDAHLLGYLFDKYQIVASCNCKDQWGTDGYTLWGGYYNQAFYASRRNGFMPAQTAEQQIPVPIFRMLGSDPIYQYEAKLGSNGQSVITLEPVYSGDEGGGGIPAWVRWFFDVNFRPEQVSFGYAQVGQENSFGWQQIKDGFIDQIEQAAELRQEGKLTVVTLAESGRWFRRRYPLTPASSISALTDWRRQGHQSVWYNSRFYRANLLRQDGRLRLRDIHLFDENYEERYLESVCEERDSRYDTLPIVDGAQWSDDTKAGLYPVFYDESGAEVELAVRELTTDESRDGELRVMLELEDHSTAVLRFSEQEIAFAYTGGACKLGLRMVWGDTPEVPAIQASSDEIRYVYQDYGYSLKLQGVENVASKNSEFVLRAEANAIKLQF